MYVDISSTFWKKLRALKKFKTQRHALLVLLWNVFFSAVKAGFATKTTFAEQFHKVI